MDKKLDKIILLLESILDSHPCRRCKALVPNGAIECVECDTKDP